MLIAQLHFARRTISSGFGGVVVGGGGGGVGIGVHSESEVSDE